MIKKIACLLLLLPQLAFADNLGVDDPLSTGWFAGIGGSYDSIRMHQQILDVGPIHMFDTTSVLTSFTSPAGTNTSYNESQSTFAPNVQLGYFRPFSACNTRLWGFKLAYKYLVLSVTDRDLDAPINGALVNLQTGNEPQVTNFTIEVSPLHVNHEIDFTAFIGQAFTNSFIYLSAGPTIFEARPNLYTLTGATQTSRTSTTITGVGGDPTASQWVWGGTAQAGMICRLGPSWFIDFNFSYAVSSHYTDYNPATFTSDIHTDPGTARARNHTTSNLGFIKTHQRITVQSVNITMNKLFTI